MRRKSLFWRMQRRFGDLIFSNQWMPAVLAGVFGLVVLTYFFCYGTQPREATRALHALNMTHVRTGSYQFFASCGRDWPYHTPFHAVDAAGKPVSGVVCGNWFGVHVTFN